MANILHYIQAYRFAGYAGRIHEAAGFVVDTTVAEMVEKSDTLGLELMVAGRRKPASDAAQGSGDTVAHAKPVEYKHYARDVELVVYIEL